MADHVTTTKRLKTTSVRLELVSVAGEALGPALDVPLATGVDDLETLVNSLRGETRQPYCFYAGSTLVDEALESYVTSTEEVFRLTYEPLAVFRVRRATRCGSTLPGHSDGVLHCVYSPNSKTVASAGGDGTVRCWDALTGTPKTTLTGHKTHVLCVAWRADGRFLASGDKRGEVRVWDGTTLIRCHDKKHSKWITAVAWAPLHVDLDLLATASKDTTVKLFKRGAAIASLSGHTDAVEAICWGGDGTLYSASRDRSVKLWTSHGTLIRSLKGHAHRVNALALSSSYVLRTGPFDVVAGSSSDDDDDLARASQRRFDAFLEKNGPEERLASCSDDATIYFWPTSARLTGHQQAINAIDFAPDGRKLASASFDHKVKLWHGSTGAFLATLSGHVASVYALAWAPDSRFLASASKDSTLKIWHAADDVKPADPNAKAKGSRKFQAALGTLAGHLDEVFAVDWAPQGAHLASASKDRTLKIWHP